MRWYFKNCSQSIGHTWEEVEDPHRDIEMPRITATTTVAIPTSATTVAPE